MNNTVWKCTLKATGIQEEIEVPVGSEILCAREQGDQICLWFRCNPAEPKEKRNIAVYGTGHIMSLSVERYIGTASFRGGQIILHIFECYK